jgi:putative FmdB family regulatory protein
VPLFDYLCTACNKRFEYLAMPGADEPQCPTCGRKDVEKQLSYFTVGQPAPTPAQKEQDLMRRAGWVPVGKPFRKR